MSSINETQQFIPLNIAVLTVSDTRALADDKSGTTLADRPAIVLPGVTSSPTTSRRSAQN